MLNITDATFKDETAHKHLTVVDLWADWCPPCKMLLPILEEVSKKHLDVSFGKLNADENREVLKDHGVRSIPTLLFYKEGKLVHTAVGYQSVEALDKLVTTYK